MDNVLDARYWHLMLYWFISNALPDIFNLWILIHLHKTFQCMRFSVRLFAQEIQLFPHCILPCFCFSLLTLIWIKIILYYLYFMFFISYFVFFKIQNGNLGHWCGAGSQYPTPCVLGTYSNFSGNIAVSY